MTTWPCKFPEGRSLNLGNEPVRAPQRILLSEGSLRGGQGGQEGVTGKKRPKPVMAKAGGRVAMLWSREAGLAHCCLWLLDSRQGPESSYVGVISSSLPNSLD